jgi:flagellar hook-associated protein 2
MGISVSGVGSGIDIESLVTQLVAAEGQPAALRISQQESTFQADLSAVGTLKNALSNLQNIVQDLQTPTDFLARSATSSDEERFTATAESTAAPGVYDIEITQLAQAARLRSSDFTSESEVIGTGTLDISLGTDTFSLTIDSNNQTLEGIRDAINSAENNPGITASIINVDSGTQLVLSSDEIGAANTISVVATDDDALDGFDLTRLATANLTTLQAAQDAIILVDQQQVTRDSNTFSDVITGVSFTLLKEEVGETATLTVGLDKATIKSRVADFVAAYNIAAQTIGQLGAFDSATGSRGQLQGDSGLRAIENDLRRAISDPVDGLDFATLAEIGITTDSTGRLTIDDTVFDEVVDNDFTAVSQLFTDDNGLSNKFDDLLERYVASDGILTSRSDNIQDRIRDLSDDRDRLDARLASIESRYRAQFTAMDALVSQLQSIGSFLTQQLASLPEPNSIGRN